MSSKMIPPIGERAGTFGDIARFLPHCRAQKSHLPLDIVA